MLLTYKKNGRFLPISEHVEQSYGRLFGSGAAVFAIHNDAVVLEKYYGSHSNQAHARRIQPDSLFHVASVRKCYIGFAVAYAVYYGKIRSIDDLIVDYFPDLDHNLWENTTVRHLLTHTHGVQEINGRAERVFPAGQQWSYEDIGINVLTELIKRTTGKTVSQIVHEQVFGPLAFQETAWFGQINEKQVNVIEGDGSIKKFAENESEEGDKKNLFASARELAFWGYLHLKEGFIGGKKIVPKEIIQMATSLQSPPGADQDIPQNGFLWFVQDQPGRKTEIGESVPIGSYQILGITGVTLLVIPSENVVAVRLFNSNGSPSGYDYLADVRSFGDTVTKCLKKKR